MTGSLGDPSPLSVQCCGLIQLIDTTFSQYKEWSWVAKILYTVSY